VSETVSLEAGLSLHSNWQILTRATLDRNVPTLLRAGADLVLSYAAMGSNTILNVLRGPDHLLLAEGVNVSLAQIPASMAGVGYRNCISARRQDAASLRWSLVERKGAIPQWMARSRLRGGFT
jgi:hypothetical protein